MPAPSLHWPDAVQQVHGTAQAVTSVLAALYSNKPPCLIFHRTALASIDVATGYASFSRLADEKLSCGVLPDIMRSLH